MSGDCGCCQPPANLDVGAVHPPKGQQEANGGSALGGSPQAPGPAAMDAIRADDGAPASPTLGDPTVAMTFRIAGPGPVAPSAALALRPQDEQAAPPLPLPCPGGKGVLAGGCLVSNAGTQTDDWVDERHPVASPQLPTQSSMPATAGASGGQSTGTAGGDASPRDMRPWGRKREAVQAAANRPVKRFKGVYTNVKTPGKWRFEISHRAKRTHACGFDTEEDAARAYDAEALRLKGPHAELNFPLPMEANHSNNSPTPATRSPKVNRSKSPAPARRPTRHAGRARGILLRSGTRTQKPYTAGMLTKKACSEDGSPSAASSFKGITKARNKWRAQLWANGKVDLGLFSTQREAIIAYNAEALLRKGPGAMLHPVPPMDAALPEAPQQERQQGRPQGQATTPQPGCQQEGSGVQEQVESLGQEPRNIQPEEASKRGMGVLPSRQPVAAHRPARAGPASGISGVWRPNKKWAARIKRGNRWVYLGSFTTKEEAGRAVEAATLRRPRTHSAATPDPSASPWPSAREALRPGAQEAGPLLPQAPLQPQPQPPSQSRLERLALLQAAQGEGPSDPPRSDAGPSGPLHAPGSAHQPSTLAARSAATLVSADPRAGARQPACGNTGAEGLGAPETLGSGKEGASRANGAPKHLFQGVYPVGTKWKAEICHTYLGRFDTQEEAARARDAAALRLKGPAATLNFPLPLADVHVGDHGEAQHAGDHARATEEEAAHAIEAAASHLQATAAAETYPSIRPSSNDARRPSAPEAGPSSPPPQPRSQLRLERPALPRVVLGEEPVLPLGIQRDPPCSGRERDALHRPSMLAAQSAATPAATDAGARHIACVNTRAEGRGAQGPLRAGNIAPVRRYGMPAPRYTGVSRAGKKWAAAVYHKGASTYVGVYETQEEAARARDAVALHVKGPDATLNFPLPLADMHAVDHGGGRHTTSKVSNQNHPPDSRYKPIGHTEHLRMPGDAAASRPLVQMQVLGPRPGGKERRRISISSPASATSGCLALLSAALVRVASAINSQRPSESSAAPVAHEASTDTVRESSTHAGVHFGAATDFVSQEAPLPASAEGTADTLAATSRDPLLRLDVELLQLAHAWAKLAVEDIPFAWDRRSRQVQKHHQGIRVLNAAVQTMGVNPAWKRPQRILNQERLGAGSSPRGSVQGQGRQPRKTGRWRSVGSIPRGQRELASKLKNSLQRPAASSPSLVQSASHGAFAVAPKAANGLGGDVMAGGSMPPSRYMSAQTLRLLHICGHGDGIMAARSEENSLPVSDDPGSRDENNAPASSDEEDARGSSDEDYGPGTRDPLNGPRREADGGTRRSAGASLVVTRGDASARVHGACLNDVPDWDAVGVEHFAEREQVATSGAPLVGGSRQGGRPPLKLYQGMPPLVPRYKPSPQLAISADMTSPACKVPVTPQCSSRGGLFGHVHTPAVAPRPGMVMDDVSEQPSLEYCQLCGREPRGLLRWRAAEPDVRDLSATVAVCCGRLTDECGCGNKNKNTKSLGFVHYACLAWTPGTVRDEDDVFFDTPKLVARAWAPPSRVGNLCLGGRI
eukprot:jgi/Mesvir1/3183/Mv16340-RA.2